MFGSCNRCIFEHNLCVSLGFLFYGFLAETRKVKKAPQEVEVPSFKFLLLNF